MEDWQPPSRRSRDGTTTTPPKQVVPNVFFDATRDSHTGIIYLKLVNIQPTAQTVEVKLAGVTTVTPDADSIELSSASEDDTNSINDPEKVVPHTGTVHGVSPDFSPTLSPYSITILKISAK
jgi:alpha-N-arabinofuranosidase